MGTGFEYKQESQDDLASQLRDDDRNADPALAWKAAEEIERLRSICRTIANGLRGHHASRLDMAKLADTAFCKDREDSQHVPRL